jgi:hypothetical protein
MEPGKLSEGRTRCKWVATVVARPIITREQTKNEALGCESPVNLSLHHGEEDQRADGQSSIASAGRRRMAIQHLFLRAGSPFAFARGFGG